MKLEDLINIGDYIVVTTDEQIHESINKDDVLWTVGTQMVHEDEEDLYNLRVKLLAHLVGSDGYVDYDAGVYIVDPQNFEKCGEADQGYFEDLNKPEEGEPQQLELV